jgi:hypothetical protein
MLRDAIKWVTLLFFVVWVNALIVVLAGAIFLNWSQESLATGNVIMMGSLGACFVGFYCYRRIK